MWKWALLLLILPAFVRAQIISTIAGNGISGYSSDNIPATASELYQPAELFFDRSGNLYISDGLNYRIRKVDASGVITTIAGTGHSGFNGDGIAATSANLDGIGKIILDDSDNIYISDGNNHRIRFINHATGIITTFAGNGVGTFAGDGGPATNASLNYPGHLAFDKNGNVYISDVENRRIRKVDRSGIITTVAGDGVLGYSGDGIAATLAELNSPHGLVCDDEGNLYISDDGNARVRKLNVGTGVITTIAGNGSFTYNGDEIAAVSAAINPQGLAMDSYGNLFIADAQGSFVSRIRRVDINGIIHAIAGTDTVGYNGDNRPAITANLYTPWDIILDTCGNIYIADANNERVRKIEYPCGYLYSSNISNPTNKVNIYPNPFWDNLHVSSFKSDVSYVIYNTVGSKIKQGTLKKNDDEISGQSLPSGIYFIELIDEEGNKTIKKLIKE